MCNRLRPWSDNVDFWWSIFIQRTFSEGRLLLNRNNWYQFLVFVLYHIIVTATAYPFVNGTFFLIQPTNLPTLIY